MMGSYILKYSCSYSMIDIKHFVLASCNVFQLYHLHTIAQLFKNSQIPNFQGLGGYSNTGMA